MKTIQNEQFFEIVDDTGEAVTNHFINRNSLNKALALYKKSDPHYHENHRVVRYVVKFEDLEIIEPPPPKEETKEV